MEGMRFGVLPIVAPTGGLADTVHDLKARSPPPPFLPLRPRARLSPNRTASRARLRAADAGGSPCTAGCECARPRAARVHS